MIDKTYCVTLSVRKTIDLWSTVDVLVNSESESGAKHKIQDMLMYFDENATADAYTPLDDLLADANFDRHADGNYDLRQTEYHVDIESITIADGTED